MTPGQFNALYRLIRDWIGKTSAASAPQVRSAGSFNLPRLPLFYSSDLLSRAKVVEVEKVPVPPLSFMGLMRFSDFEKMHASGITYLDTYFVRTERSWDESLHFHELVHVVQWRVLGPERFLALYADGLERYGYRNSPVEVMAYELQARFDAGGARFDVEGEVERRLLVPS